MVEVAALRTEQAVLRADYAVMERIVAHLLADAAWRAQPKPKRLSPTVLAFFDVLTEVARPGDRVSAASLLDDARDPEADEFLRRVVFAAAPAGKHQAQRLGQVLGRLEGLVRHGVRLRFVTRVEHAAVYEFEAIGQEAPASPSFLTPGGCSG